MAEHDESKLPVGAQKRMQYLRQQIEALEGLRSAHSLLAIERRDWFTIPGPRLVDEKPMHLWLLDRDRPTSVCDIGRGDVLLVGRAARVSTPGTPQA